MKGDLLMKKYEEMTYEEIHRSIWEWVAQGNAKDTWPGFSSEDSERIVKTYNSYNCAACAYALAQYKENEGCEYEDVDKHFCDYCPLEWEMDITCGLLYFKWFFSMGEYGFSSIPARFFASEIRDLKWIEEKLFVGKERE